MLPARVLDSFRLRARLFLLGSLEPGLTVLRQQRRAHNLIWALRKEEHNVPSIAVIGGGIAGLTAASCAISLFKDTKVTLFERAWDLCPLQQGCDTRWIHPRIYDWPKFGSRAPEASLPVLNWSEGRASDVAREILRQFASYYRAFANQRFEIFLGTHSLKVNSDTNEIHWTASPSLGMPPFFGAGEPYTAKRNFDFIILACGFGLERLDGFSTPSYWRNEELSQSMVAPEKPVFLVSGVGDGALVDLSRLTIDGFRQDAILYELFNDIEDFEEKVRRVIDTTNFLEVLRGPLATALKEPRERLRQRLRKDVRVVLHASGSRGKVREFSDIFTQRSSHLNRLILYLLDQCGALTMRYDTLEQTMREFAVPTKNVICRHGTDVMDHLAQVFFEPNNILERLKAMRQTPGQESQSLWHPGTFPVLT